MEIELNPHFKPNACVLYCGSAVYATLQSREEPVTAEGYIRTWKVRVLRRGTNRYYYVRMRNGIADLIKGVAYATQFPTYAEADDIAQRFMKTGTIIESEVIEILKFEYEDDSYAT